MDVDGDARRALDQGAAELWLRGDRVGYLTSALEQGWGPARPLGTQTFVWFLVTLSNGDRYIIEDYPPYATVPDVLAGSLEAEVDTQPPFEVRWLDGRAREQVWRDVGIHEPIGSYRFAGAVVSEWWWSRQLRRLRSQRTDVQP